MDAREGGGIKEIRLGTAEEVANNILWRSLLHNLGIIVSVRLDKGVIRCHCSVVFRLVSEDMIFLLCCYVMEDESCAF